MYMAGSARHQEDFIQAKIRDTASSISQLENAGIYVYNKTIWEIKPWDYPSGKTFRVFRGKDSVPAQIVEMGSGFHDSEHVVDVPVELEAAFRAQPINAALRDICGIASAETGNFIVEVERVTSFFERKNMFATPARLSSGQAGLAKRRCWD